MSSIMLYSIAKFGASGRLSKWDLRALNMGSVTGVVSVNFSLIVLSKIFKVFTEVVRAEAFLRISEYVLR